MLKDIGINKMISIVTPSYNSSKFISETIESAISQTYQSWEMIIVDDCSTDGSQEIIKEYCKNDSRIKLFALEDNSGAAVARNRAINEANGEYIAFLDSDDLWTHDKLEKQLAFMQKNNYAFTYTFYKKIDEKGMSLNKNVTPPISIDYNGLLKNNVIGCLTVMYSVDVLGKIYMPLIRKRQDYATWLKILKTGIIGTGGRGRVPV